MRMFVISYVILNKNTKDFIHRVKEWGCSSLESAMDKIEFAVTTILNNPPAKFDDHNLFRRDFLEENKIVLEGDEYQYTFEVHAVTLAD